MSSGFGAFLSCCGRPAKAIQKEGAIRPSGSIQVAKKRRNVGFDVDCFHRNIKLLGEPRNVRLVRESTDRPRRTSIEGGFGTLAVLNDEPLGADTGSFTIFVRPILSIRSLQWQEGEGGGIKASSQPCFSWSLVFVSCFLHFDLTSVAMKRVSYFINPNPRTMEALPGGTTAESRSSFFSPFFHERSSSSLRHQTCEKEQ